jgi:hypothetical protein
MVFFVAISAPQWHVLPGGMKKFISGLTPTDLMA